MALKVSSKGKSSQWRRPQLPLTDHQPDVVREEACDYGVHIFLGSGKWFKASYGQGSGNIKTEDKVYRSLLMPTTEDALHNQMDRILRLPSPCP